MSNDFIRIGLFAKPNSRDITETLKSLIQYLIDNEHVVYIEELSASSFAVQNAQVLPASEIIKNIDLAIVVGGDGSLLKASRSVVTSEVPILGINRGRLGFLADIPPKDFSNHLSPIIHENKYVEERRTLLEIQIMCNDEIIETHLALNDVVLYNGDVARMIEFEIFIDEQYVMTQRADGVITSTPTGSTAYSLSAGGPILYPTLNAFNVVPMFPHTLSSRPIVVHSNSTIRLKIIEDSNFIPKISCDGQDHVALPPNSSVVIKKYATQLKLLHPEGYNYYALLRQKLGWNSKVSSDR